MTETLISSNVALHVNRSELSGILENASKAVNARSPKPILMCVKVIAEDNRVTILASDMELSIRHSTTLCQIESVGEICLPAEKFKTAVEKCNDETIEILVKNDRCKISDKDGEANLYTQNAMDFPAIVEDEADSIITLKGADLLTILKRTSFAVPNEDRSGCYRGTLFDFRDKSLTLVATDGRRIALAKIAGGSETRKGIVPQKATKLLESMIDDAEEMIEIQMKDNGITFKTDSWMISSNLLEGEFPDYAKVIPESFDKKIIAGTSAFAAAVDRASQMCSEESKGIKMEVSTLAGAIFSAAAAGKGDAIVRLSCKYTGEEIVIGLNHEFLLEGIKAANADEVVVEMNSPVSPVKLTIADPNWLYLLSPINIQ